MHCLLSTAENLLMGKQEPFSRLALKMLTLGVSRGPGSW